MHANGFSLVRRLLERAGIDPTPRGALGGATVADALLEPTRIYASAVRELMPHVDVRAMAHVTGGGIPGNLARRAPGRPRRRGSTWDRGRVPRCSTGSADLGVEEEEMRRVFNLGLGFLVVVPPTEADAALRVARAAATPRIAWADRPRRRRRAGLGALADPLTVGVLVSGTGSNLQALLDELHPM